MCVRYKECATETKTYRPKIEEEVHVDVPSYLQPFMLEENHEGPGDNKVNKKPIKIKNCS